MSGDDGVTHGAFECARVEAAEEIPQVRVESVHVDVGAREHGLKGIERREGLQLDQLGLKLAGGVADEPEIHLHKHRPRRFVGYVELGRDGSVGALAVIGILDELADERFTIFAHALDHGLRKEGRRFA